MKTYLGTVVVLLLFVAAVPAGKYIQSNDAIEMHHAVTILIIL